MVGTLRDPERQQKSEVARTSESEPESALWAPEQDERRPPVLGIVFVFIILFWGGLGLIWALWPR